MAGRRPVRAEAVGVGFGAIESDKWNSSAAQVPDQLFVARLQADDKPGASRFQEIMDLVDELFGRISYPKPRIMDFQIGGHGGAGEPEMPDQSVLADIGL